MPEITNPALLNQLNATTQPSAPPTIYRTQPKQAAPVRPEVEQGNVLSNQQKQQSLREGPLDIQKKQLDIEEKRRKLEAGDAASASEGERKNAAFLRRAIGANDVYDGLGIGPRSYIGNIAQESAPGLLNQLPADIGNSPERQQADAAELEFVSAVLRSDSGAAIPENEIIKAKELYFPQPGDEQAVIDQKREARRRAIEGLRSSSGRLAEEALGGKALTVDVEASPEQGAPGEKIERDGVIVGFYDAQGNRVDIDTGPNFDAEGNPVSTDDLNSNAAEEYARYFGGGLGDVVETVGDTLGIVGNPLNTAINAATGSSLSTDLGATFREASGLPDNNNPYSSAINQGGTAALLGMGGGAVAKSIGQGVTKAVGSTLTAQPAAQTVGGATAALSAETAAQNDVGPAGQLAAGLAGGLGGFSVANRAGSIAQKATGAPNQLAQAAERQGVELLPAQTGGTATRALTAGSRQGFISDIPIAKAVERTTKQTEAVRNRSASDVGDALDKEDAGELVRSAANIYSKKTGETGSKLYDRALRKAGDTKAALPGAIKSADTALAKIAETPGGKETALYKEIAGLRDNMKGGKFSIEGVRNMRTTLREEAAFKGLRGSNTNRIYSDIVEAASDDITAALTKAGKEDAAQAFKTADKFWKARVETIDEVLEPLLGKNSQKSGENILSALERMANKETGDSAKLRRLLTALPETEANNVRASVIQRLGKPTAGQQTDGDFSLGKFLTDWNKMSDKSKALIFKGESKAALDDLARIAMADKDASKFLNSSNTARSVGVQAAISGTAGVFISPLTAISIGGGQFALGKLLASPKFARWLSKVPTTEQQKLAHIERLGTIAAKEPVIANDIRSVQEFLRNAPSSPGQIAASEKIGDGGEEPPEN